MRVAALVALWSSACVEVVYRDPEQLGDVDIAVTTTVIPEDATCTHIVATRLSDFQTSEYRGLLAGAEFKGFKGDNRITATAYPLPCEEEPEVVPWVADPANVTLAGGTNFIKLTFKSNAKIVIEPEFEIESTLSIHDETRILPGRSGEDISAPNFAVDGYKVTQLSLPPSGGGPASETTLFSIEGLTSFASFPRGLAVTSGGLFIVQSGLPAQAFEVYNAAGNLLESWPLVSPPGFIQWGDYSDGHGDYTDGLEQIDDTHFVRTGFRFEPLCDVSGCIQSGLDIMERQVQPGGSSNMVVVQQVIMPESIGFHSPLGVTPLGSNFAVSILPGDETIVPRLMVVAPDGTIVAGPVDSGILEGLLVAADGRLIGGDYGGLVAYDTDLTPRPAESASLQYNAGISLPSRFAWDRNTDTYLAITNTPHVLIRRADPSFTSGADTAIDLSSYSINGRLSFDVRSDTNQALVSAGMPVFDPDQPEIVPYNIATGFQDPSIFLQGWPTPALVRSIAFIESTQQLATTGQQFGNPAMRSVVFVHQLDGSLAYTFDVAPIGFPVVGSVSYDPNTDELNLVGTDELGLQRILVTDINGNPRRSYRTDAIGFVTDLAPISSGPNAGEVGLLGGDPTLFARAAPLR
jgi:hypothetical protein